MGVTLTVSEPVLALLSTLIFEVLGRLVLTLAAVLVLELLVLVDLLLLATGW